MNKRFTKLIAALALLVFMTPSLAGWGQSQAVLPNTQALTTEFVNVGEDEHIQIKTSSANTYTNPLRFYANVTATIQAVEGYKILSVTYEASSTGNYVTYAENATVTPEVTPTVSGKNVTWDYSSSATDVTEYTFKPTSQTRCNSITIVYTTIGGTVNPTCATPTFSPAAGTYTEAQTVSINCATEGATIYYTTDGDDPTTNSTVYNNPISVSSNMTIKAMATADGYNNSTVATAAYTIVNIQHAGTEADPYTVADARAAIDANVGTQGVYATGIVCTASPQLYQSKYLSYYISADGLTTSDQLEAYNGLSFDGASFTSKDDVQVGDEVVIYGNLTKHNTTYEFAQDNVLVSLVRPQNPSITVTPATINAPFAGAEGTLTVTYENITTLGADVYFCNAAGTEAATYDWVTASVNETTNNVDYLIEENEGEARTAYLKVWAYDDDMNEVYSDIVTINQAEYVPPTYAELPFEFNDGKAAIEETDGLSQEGLGSDYSTDNTKLKFDHTGDWLLLQFNERPGTLTFDIKNNSFSGGTFTVQTSEDGVTYTDLETYTEITGTQNEEFTDLGENVRYIKWVYTNKSSGNVGLGNIALAKYEAPVPAITVESTTITATAAETEGTLNVTYTAIETSLGASIYWYTDATGVTVTDEPEWVSAEINETTLTVDYIIAANEGEARTAYFKVYALDGDGNDVYSELVTVSQAAPVAPPTPGNWVSATLAELTPADVFVIVGSDGDETYALPHDGGSSNSPTAVEVAITNTTLSENPGENLQWNLIVSNNSYIFYPVGDSENWLYCTNSNTGVRVGTNNNKLFILEDGYLKNIATERYIGFYKGSNGTDWRCYTSNTGNIAGQAFSFYKKVSEPVTKTMDIVGYGSNAGGYKLIASPVASVTPSADNGFLTSEYDLYAFDQAEADEWRNYKASSFNLVSGKGYLYASSTATTLTFVGQPYNGNGLVTLDYTEGADLAGWNLIGNPYATAATLSQPFYRLAEGGSEVSAES